MPTELTLTNPLNGNRRNTGADSIYREIASGTLEIKRLEHIC